MKEITDYYFDLQNIADIDDCSDNCNDNVLLLFKQMIKSILKDNTEYDITIIDNDTELFKMTGGDGVSTFPYKQFEEILDFLFQKSKFIQEKKDYLYNSLFHVEHKNEPVTPMIDPVTPTVEPVTPTVDPVTPMGEPVTPMGEPLPPMGEPVTPMGEPLPPMGEPLPPMGEPVTPTVDPVTPTVEPVTPIGEPVTTIAGSSNNNNINNQNDIIQNQPMQVGGYKIIEKQLIKNMNNIITVKLTLYNNNNFKKSFIKKIRYSQ